MEEENFLFGPDKIGKLKLSRSRGGKNFKHISRQLVAKKSLPRRWWRNENKGPNSKRRFYAGQINSQTSDIQNISLAINLAKKSASKHTHTPNNITHTQRCTGASSAGNEWGIPSPPFYPSPVAKDCLSVCLTVAAFWQNTETKSTSLQVVEQKIEKYFQAFVAIVGCQTRYPQQCRLLYPKNEAFCLELWEFPAV